MPDDEDALRTEICRVGISLFQRGYTVGTSGNISARLPDGWLITPTDACFGYLEPAMLAKVGLDGSRLSGNKPSKTLHLHRAIYATDPGIGAVVHTHSTSLVQLTLTGVWRETDVLPPITPYFVMKLGHVPLVRYYRPGDPQVAEHIRALPKHVRAVLLERLGPVVWGETPLAAACALEELEETAKLWLRSDPKPAALAEPALDELRTAFGTTW